MFLPPTARTGVTLAPRRDVRASSAALLFPFGVSKAALQFNVRFVPEYDLAGMIALKEESCILSVSSSVVCSCSQNRILARTLGSDLT